MEENLTPQIVVEDNVTYYTLENNGVTFYYSDISCKEIVKVIHQNGVITYWKNNKRHNSKTAAVIYSNGDQEWWINGNKLQCITQKEFEKLMKISSFW